MSKITSIQKKIVKSFILFVFVLLIIQLSIGYLRVNSQDDANQSLAQNAFAMKDELNTTWAQGGTGTLLNPGGTNQYIYFGHYTQNLISGSNYSIDPIKWRILQKDGDKLYLMSDKILDHRTHTPNTGNIFNPIQWIYSSLYSWLKSTFLTTAFTYDEQNIMSNETVSYSYRYSGWQNTTVSNQKIWLLSGDTDTSHTNNQEIRNTTYGFSNNSNSTSDSRKLTDTNYASFQASTNNSWQTSTVSPKTGGNSSFAVDSSGILSQKNQDNKAGVVPVFKLNLSNVIFASTVSFKSSESGGYLSDSDFVMNLRFSNSSYVTNDIDYSLSSDRTKLYVQNASLNTTLVLQGNRSGTYWYYSKPVDNLGECNVTLTDLQSMGINNMTNLENIKIWTERLSPNDNFIYASTPQDTSSILVKEEIPNADFEASTMEFWIDDNTRIQYSLTGPNGPWSNMTSTLVILNERNLSVQSDILVRKLGDEVYTTTSDIQTIDLTRFERPTFISSERPKETEGNGYITYVRTNMEYMPIGLGDHWIQIISSYLIQVVDEESGEIYYKMLVPEGAYEVRIRGSGHTLPSASEYSYVTFMQLPKEDIPQAVFDTATGKLSNVLPGMTYSLNDDVSWIDIEEVFEEDENGYGYIILNVSDVNEMDNILIIMLGDGETTIDSDAQEIDIIKPSPPLGVAKIDQQQINGTGSIIGVNDTMEYRAAGTTDWISISSTTISELPVGNYEVRYKATGVYIASHSVTIAIGQYIPSREPQPAANFEASDRTLTINESIMRIRYRIVNGENIGNWINFTSSIMYLTSEYLNNDTLIEVQKLGDSIYTLDSTVQQIYLIKSDSPEIVRAVNAAYEGGTGALQLVDNTMEYRLKGTVQWLPITLSEEVYSLENLAPGTYEIRYKAKGIFLESEAVERNIIILSDATVTIVGLWQNAKNINTMEEIVVVLTNTSTGKKYNGILHYDGTNPSGEVIYKHLDYGTYSVSCLSSLHWKFIESSFENNMFTISKNNIVITGAVTNTYSPKNGFNDFNSANNRMKYTLE